MRSMNTHPLTDQEIGRTVSTLLEQRARRATKYLSEKFVITATRRHKPDGRANRVEVLVTIGAPNYAGREFVKACKKAGEKFPVKKVQLKFWK